MDNKKNEFQNHLRSNFKLVYNTSSVMTICWIGPQKVPKQQRQSVVTFEPFDLQTFNLRFWKWQIVFNTQINRNWAWVRIFRCPWITYDQLFMIILFISAAISSVFLLLIVMLSFIGNVLLVGTIASSWTLKR